jgi:hypothetical protein
MTLPGSPPNASILFFHPIERGHDVQHSGRARGCVLLAQQIAQVDVAHQSQAVVVRDHHDIVILGQREAIVRKILRPDIRAAVAGGEAAAVRIEHHRPLAAVCCAGSPDVEHQAVFARGRRFPFLGPAWIGRLNRLRAVRKRIPHTAPGFQCRRRFEAIGAGWRPSVRDALENGDAILARAADLAARGLGDYRIGSGRGLREQER